MDAHKALITNIFNNSTLVEVPFFQRSYVWKEDLWGRLLEDMEFVVKTKKPHFLGSIILKEGRKPRQGENFADCRTIVDGQQRLTTNYKAYCNHEDFRNIVLDLGRGRFVESEQAIRTNQIPVGIVLNRDDAVLFEYTNKKSALRKPEVTNVLLQVRSKIKNYNYTINSAEDLDEDEQIEWFEVLNNAGSRVSIIQMRFSKLKAHGIDIYKQYTSVFNNRLIEVGYDFFTPEKTTVSYPISALNPAYELVMNKVHSNNFAPIPSDTKENQLCNISMEDLKRCIELTLEVEDKVIDFIENNALKQPDRIDYINYLIGFFIFNASKIDDKVKARLLIGITQLILQISQILIGEICIPT